jgi:hypothetical protein
MDWVELACSFPLRVGKVGQPSSSITGPEEKSGGGGETRLGSRLLFALARGWGREITIVFFTVRDQANDLQGSGARDKRIGHGLSFSCHDGSGSAGGGSIVVAEASARASPRGRCRGERVGADKDDVAIFVRTGFPLGLDMETAFEGKLALEA